MYGRSHPRNLFPTKQTFRVSCFPSKGFMFPLSRQLQGFHMPPLISNQSGQQPVSNVSCSSLSGRAVPRKPLLSWLLRNPLGQPPVAQCRRTGEIRPRLMRNRLIAKFSNDGKAVPRRPSLSAGSGSWKDQAHHAMSRTSPCQPTKLLKQPPEQHTIPGRCEAVCCRLCGVNAPTAHAFW